ncbi:SDR family oxidoreductase [Vibrio caribbeanicus]|uniref:SDR family oxidoreductase n=1 Tax=Vibrio caribbeanicus TaxID=701175 RepID=UPI002284AF4C|nr:SDR family oxidoreductase [Vibrio caribbeanicus]MCY9845372.1 SDR family oxidoreductase [Vibrio caribbeanicus]
MPHSILITGCSTGIGYAAAHALKEKGYNVIASCRQEKDVSRLQSEGLTSILLDLSNPDSITEGVRQALQISDGKLYAVFNNGAYGQPGALEDLPTEALKEQFETNFFGWHQLVTEVLPSMRKQNCGRIIQNSSVLGFAALKYRGAYNASKFAIEGWSDTLRLELMETNIHISLIEPGPIETQFRANAQRAFKRWIKVENSAHEKYYRQQLERLKSKTSSSAFVLPPESCIPPLIDALEAKKPKIRYRVTTPTKVFAFLKRVLTARMLDTILNRAT